jgi:hypothetical protein
MDLKLLMGKFFEKKTILLSIIENKGKIRKMAKPHLDKFSTEPKKSNFKTVS